MENKVEFSVGHKGKNIAVTALSMTGVLGPSVFPLKNAFSTLFEECCEISHWTQT